MEKRDVIVIALIAAVLIAVGVGVPLAMLASTERQVDRYMQEADEEMERVRGLVESYPGEQGTPEEHLRWLEQAFSGSAADGR